MWPFSQLARLLKKEESEEEKILIDLDEAIKSLKEIDQRYKEWDKYIEKYTELDRRAEEEEHRSKEVMRFGHGSYLKHYIVNRCLKIEEITGAAIKWLNEAILRMDLLENIVIDVKKSIKKEPTYRSTTLSSEQKNLFDQILEAKVNIRGIITSLLTAEYNTRASRHYSGGSVSDPTNRQGFKLYDYGSNYYPECEKDISYLKSLKESIEKILTLQKEAKVVGK